MTNTCTQSTSNTIPAPVTGYTCPSGYALSGSTCTLTTPTSSPATVTYSCPAGWNLSGGTCSSTTSSPATPVYSCPAGYTLSGTTCTGPSSYTATGSLSCNGRGTLQAYANSPSGYKCIVQSILTSDYPDPYGQCLNIAASMGLPLVAAPLVKNGKFMECTMGPVTVYSCPSGGTLSGNTCNTTVTQAASVSGYTCPTGTLSGTSCLTGSSQAATATYSCPNGQTLSGTTCYGTSTTSTPGTPVYGCPSGYTLAGSTCTLQGSTTIPATPSFTCPNGGTLAGATCAGALTRTRYEPYGNTAAGTVPSDLGFTGHVNDANTGLVYMQQRYYDPIAGRFLSVDPVVTDANTAGSFGRYHYANNNPFRFFDPDGADGAEHCSIYPCQTITAAAIAKATVDTVDNFWTGGYGKQYQISLNNGNYGYAALEVGAGTLYGLANVMSFGRAGAILNVARVPVGKELAASAENAARGLSKHGGTFSPTLNSAGGEVWTSIGKISQNDFATLVNSGLYKGNVNIISGVHGASSGITTAAADLFKADMARFGNISGVTVHNFLELTPGQITGLLRGPGTTIGGFCDSGACLAAFR